MSVPAELKPAKRTEKQSDCLHLWLRQVAQVLNDAGLSQEVVLEALRDRNSAIEIPWTEGSAKENIWKPVQKAMIGQESTTQAGRSDYDAERIGLTKWFGQTFGVELPPWPDRFNEGSEQ